MPMVCTEHLHHLAFTVQPRGNSGMGQAFTFVGWRNIVKVRMLHWLFEVNLSVCKHLTLTHSQSGTHYINYGHKIGYGNIRLGLV